MDYMYNNVKISFDFRNILHKHLIQLKENLYYVHRWNLRKRPWPNSNQIGNNRSLFPIYGACLLSGVTQVLLV